MVEAVACGNAGNARLLSGMQQLSMGRIEPQLGKQHDMQVFQPFLALRSSLEGPFKDRIFLWQRQGGPKGDLVDDEMSRVIQVPGWLGRGTRAQDSITPRKSWLVVSR